MERAELLRRRRRGGRRRAAVIERGGYWMALLAAAPLYLTYRTYKVYSAASRTSSGTCRRCRTCTWRRSKRWRSPSTRRIRPRRAHIRRVQVYAAGLAARSACRENEIQGVKTAALLHDIGKLAVPEHILSKPGPLTQEEFQKIRIHPQVGAEIISGVPFPYPVAPLILSHHERWDGKGYPAGLKGDEIPLGARILSVVDYFDALMSERPYHKAMSFDAAIGAAAAGERQGARSRAWCRCSSTCIRRWRPRPTPSQEPARKLTRVPTHATAAQPGRRAGRPSRPARTNVFEDIALAHREIYALYEIAQAMGTQPRRRRHDGAHLVEAEQPRAVLVLRAVPLQRGDRDAALPLRDRRRGRRRFSS